MNNAVPNNNPVPAAAPEQAQPAAAPAANPPSTVADMFADIEQQEVMRAKDRAWRKVNMRSVNAGIACFEKKQRERGEAGVQTVPEEMARKIFSFLRGEPGLPAVPSHPEKIFAASEFAVSASYTDANGQQVTVQFSGLPSGVHITSAPTRRLTTAQSTCICPTDPRPHVVSNAITNTATSTLLTATTNIPVMHLKSLRLFVGNRPLAATGYQLVPTVDGAVLLYGHFESARTPDELRAAHESASIGTAFSRSALVGAPIGGIFPYLNQDALDKFDSVTSSPEESQRKLARFHEECERHKPSEGITLYLLALCIDEKVSSTAPGAVREMQMQNLSLANQRCKKILEVCGVPVTEEAAV
ncbi:unnamed protein product [Amoebophrya sp. A120]|nr:unnamed protein product [Amoebophrya sp. A120]|eukprot:GSA120T00026299001.1